jgi:NAD/NADP transhydrogenase beta subunit
MIGVDGRPTQWRTPSQRRATTAVGHAAVFLAAMFVGGVIGAAIGSRCTSMESMIVWHSLIHTAATLVGFAVLAGVLCSLRWLVQKQQRP